VLGHAFGRIGRHAHDLDAMLGGGSDIHRVESGRAQRDQLDAKAREFFQRGGIDAVVHKRANGVKAGGQRHSAAVQTVFKEFNLVAKGLVSLRDGGFIVTLAVKYGDAHGISLWVVFNLDQFNRGSVSCSV